MPNIPLTATSGSSAISHIGYDPATKTLAVRMASGKLYHAEGVEPEEHEQFRGADSLGRHFHANLRSKYTFVPIDEDATGADEDPAAGR